MQRKSFKLIAGAILGSALLASAVPASAASSDCWADKWHPVCTTGVVHANLKGRYLNVTTSAMYGTWRVWDINTGRTVGSGSTGWRGSGRRIPGLYGYYKGSVSMGVLKSGYIKISN
jgi:hypothetical protein